MSIACPALFGHPEGVRFTPGWRVVAAQVSEVVPAGRLERQVTVNSAAAVPVNWGGVPIGLTTR